MSNDKENKKGVIIFGLAAAGAGILMATRAGAVAPPDGGLSLVILDEWGNPVPRSPAARSPVGRDPVGRGPVMAGAVLNLVPGNYSAQVTVHNLTTTDGVAAPATLTTVLSSDLTGFSPTTDPVAYTAGQTLAKTYPFTVTNAQIGQSGKKITVVIKDPNGVQLATDFATVNVVTPAIVLGALTATKLYSTSVPAGVVPGSTLNLKNGDAFWADLSFQYQYQGGNYTFLAEINVNGAYQRSFKDMTLPDSPTLATVNLTTANTDLFAPGSLPLAALLDMRLSLIFRGFGTDTSQWTSVLTKTYTGACQNVTITAPPQITEWDIKIGTAAYVIMTNNMPLTKDLISFLIKVNYTGQALAKPTYACSIIMKLPDGTANPGNMAVQSVSAVSGPASGPGVFSGYTEFYPNRSLNQVGTYQFTVTLTVNGVVAGTSVINAVVQSTTIYGAEVTIS